MNRARIEAGCLGVHRVESEHLLLGLIHEDAFLESLFPLAAARAAVAACPIRKRRWFDAQPPALGLSHECKRVLAYAAEEAERLGHLPIATGHLALGMLREPSCEGAALLGACGLEAERLREHLRATIPRRGATMKE